MARLRGSTTHARVLASAVAKVLSKGHSLVVDSSEIEEVNKQQINTYSSLECERQAIDAEIKLLEESSLASKRRRNALSPISSLPTKVIVIIFSYFRLPSHSVSTISSLPDEVIDDLFRSCRLPGTPPPGRSPDHRSLAWLRVAHVCHRWREIALNYPLFWSHVDFTNLTLAGAREILARAKNAPLHLEARTSHFAWDLDNSPRLAALEKEIQARVSQICHLSINAASFRLQRIVKGLTSPAVTLEYLSLSSQDNVSSCKVPYKLFGGTAPRLSSLELRNCDISLKSPLLKGLRYLDARTESASARRNLADWLDALREMPHLEKLVLHSCSTIVLPSPSGFDIKQVVILPSLTHLDISATTENCGLTLSCLFLPALTRLCVSSQSNFTHGGDLQGAFLSLLEHADGPQDTEPLQSVLISSERTRANILAWSIPNIDVDAHDPFALLSVALSARVALSVKCSRYVPAEKNCLLDRAIAALPLESIVTLTAQHRSYLDAQFWLCNAPKWHLLQCVRLALEEARGFIEMLLEDSSGHAEHPLLPSLITLVLIDVALTARRAHRLCDALMKRVEQGVPLETLDLRTCRATTFTVQLLSEIVVDVWGPAESFETKELLSLDSAVRGPFVTEDPDNSEPEGDEEVDV
ncbi:hypothetical protein EI94DRAFT_1924775 [Lactarius quietus]|nr:hypothetical protein EI94DRAFT_1924775 [Lactarius quietus]